MNLLVRAFHAGTPSKVHAVRGLIDTTRSVIEKLSPEFVVFAGEGGHSQRAKLYPGYKGSRPPKPPELLEQIELAEEMIETIGWPLIRVAGWEADDVLASLATQLSTHAAGVFVVSSDKDLLQLLADPTAASPSAARIPGDGVLPVIYQPWDGGKRMNRQAVVDKFGVTAGQLGDYLALVGDTSDDIPGVKGVGEKTAAELLNKFGTLEAILEKARCLMIPGAVGKKLHAQADMARLSRQLVELRRGIPIPSDWQRWPVQSPRPNWLAGLQNLGLGSAGQRLAEQIPVVGIHRDGVASMWFEWSEVGSGEQVRVEQLTEGVVDGGSGSDVSCDSVALCDSGVASRVATDTSVETDRDGGASVETDGVSSGNGPVAGVADSGGGSFSWRRDLPRTSSRAGEAHDAPEWVRSYVAIIKLGTNATREEILRSVYANGWHRGRQSPGCENGYKPTSELHFVEQLGIDGKPFVLPTQQPAASPPMAMGTPGDSTHHAERDGYAKTKDPTLARRANAADADVVTGQKCLF